jgi:hypothetical protein
MRCLSGPATQRALSMIATGSPIGLTVPIVFAMGMPVSIPTAIWLVAARARRVLSFFPLPEGVLHTPFRVW